MALEQVALASWTIWPLVVLAFLTTTEQVVLVSRTKQKQVIQASRVTWEQMALASLIDAAACDSFWQSMMPSSQTALHLQASMDALVVSRSSRALLAFAQSSITCIGGVMLLVLETAAIGEMLAGMPSREASVALTLAWDEVSTGQSGPSGFWGGVMWTTAGLGLLGDECSDLQLDVSSIAQDRSLLTSIVILPSNFGGDLWGLATTMLETSSRGGIFWSSSSTGGEAISIPQ